MSTMKAVATRIYTVALLDLDVSTGALARVPARIPASSRAEAELIALQVCGSDARFARRTKSSDAHAR